MYSGLQELPHLPPHLGKKMAFLKVTLTKIEGILYELALLSEGGLSVRAPAPTLEPFEKFESQTGGGEGDNL